MTPSWNRDKSALREMNGTSYSWTSVYQWGQHRLYCLPCASPLRLWQLQMWFFLGTSQETVQLDPPWAFQLKESSLRLPTRLLRSLQSGSTSVSSEMRLSLVLSFSSSFCGVSTGSMAVPLVQIYRASDESLIGTFTSPLVSAECKRPFSLFLLHWRHAHTTMQ